jgi:hypothetical protein
MTKVRFVPSSTVCDVDGRIVRFALCVQLSQSLITAAKVSAALPLVIPSEAEGSAVLSTAKQPRRRKALKAAGLLEGEAHRRSLRPVTL